MGRPRLPWVKLWCDMLADPQMKQLTIGERGCFAMMLLAAQGSPIRGSLALTDTRPMSVEEIADTISLKNDDIHILTSAIAKLLEFGILEYTPDKLLVISHFLDRQNVYESDLRDYHKPKMNTPDKLLIDSGFKPLEVRGERGEGRRKTPTPPILPKKEIIKKEISKKPYGEFKNVLLTDGEHQKLEEKFGAGLPGLIETLSAGMESHGYKYKSHYAAILNWARREGGQGGRTNETRGVPGNRPAGAFDDIKAD